MQKHILKKSKKTEITIAKIIESAMTEFGTNGYTGGTVNNICKAGINEFIAVIAAKKGFELAGEIKKQDNRG